MSRSIDRYRSPLGPRRPRASSARTRPERAGVLLPGIHRAKGAMVRHAIRWGSDAISACHTRWKPDDARSFPGESTVRAPDAYGLHLYE
jgi:hypothetical protein